MQVQRLEYKPPATLALIATQVALHYMDTSALFSSLSEVSDVLSSLTDALRTMFGRSFWILSWPQRALWFAEHGTLFVVFRIP